MEILNEMETPADIDALCDRLIPLGKTGDQFWSDAARDVLRGALH